LKLYSIGFTKKSAPTFFELLRRSTAKRVVDVRLNYTSQLSGFAKSGDLEYFLKKICRMSYVHLPQLAPTREMLDSYRKDHRDWDTYERQFLDLMEERGIERLGLKEDLSNRCLLCSEDKPDRCHRRLVAEYLQHHWSDLEIIHLV